MKSRHTAKFGDLAAQGEVLAQPSAVWPDFILIGIVVALLATDSPIADLLRPGVIAVVALAAFYVRVWRNRGNDEWWSRWGSARRTVSQPTLVADRCLRDPAARPL